jgi:exopolysaccharide production protein ExoY
VKRLLDVVAALLLLILAAPLLVGAAVGVFITSGRPVLFGHRRIGRNGVPFRCWKLRTMQTDAEHVLSTVPSLQELYVANGYKLPHAADPRLTSFGRVLRRTYVDELPQLVNVLNGTMSLIGPRPIVEQELSNYGEDGAELLRVRPGIIGEWTSRGRERPPYPERARLELTYIRERSLSRDVRILLRTVPVVLLGQTEDA